MTKDFTSYATSIESNINAVKRDKECALALADEKESENRFEAYVPIDW